MLKTFLKYGLIASFFAISASVATAKILVKPKTSNLEAVLVKYQRRAFKNPFVKVYRGPFNAVIESVYDADTVNVLVFPWPSISVRTKVRIRGIDTPERRRYKCTEEKQLAKLSTDYVKGLLPKGARVQLTDVSFGKYANRVIGNLMIGSINNKWTSLGETLLAAGYAKPYFGKKKKGWCP